MFLQIKILWYLILFNLNSCSGVNCLLFLMTWMISLCGFSLKWKLDVKLGKKCANKILMYNSVIWASEVTLAFHTDFCGFFFVCPWLLMRLLATSDISALGQILILKLRADSCGRRGLFNAIQCGFANNFNFLNRLYKKKKKGGRGVEGEGQKEQFNCWGLKLMKAALFY